MIYFLFFIFFICILSYFIPNNKKTQFIRSRKYSISSNESSDNEAQEEITDNQLKRDSSLDDDSKIVEVIKKRRRNMSPTRKRYPCIIERWEVEDALRNI